MTSRRPPTWPVIPLALPAAVSIWAGWVGLGQLTGFGVVQLLPGIWDELTINTAVTLPIGMESYAAYALYVWLHRGTPRRARDFARVSSIAALMLGALGQVAFHLMAAAGVQSAPWPITAAVACLPVAVLGMGCALAHLLGTEDDDQPVKTLQPAEGFPAQQPPTPQFRPAMSAPPVVAPVFQAVPNRPAPVDAGRPAEPPRVDPPDHPDPSPRTTPLDVPAGRPADRPAGRPDDHPANRPDGQPAADATGAKTERRNGATRRPTRKRTDAQLLGVIRDLSERNGGEPPTQYAVRRATGVGGSRAARLIDELAATAEPAAAPSSNGGTRHKEKDATT